MAIVVIIMWRYAGSKVAIEDGDWGWSCTWHNHNNIIMNCLSSFATIWFKSLIVTTLQTIIDTRKTTTMHQVGEVELYFNKIMSMNNILKKIRFVVYIVGRW